MMQVPVRVPAEYEQAPKHARLCIVTVNQTCICDWKYFSHLTHTVHIRGFLHVEYDAFVGCATWLTCKCWDVFVIDCFWLCTHLSLTVFDFVLVFDCFWLCTCHWLFLICLNVLYPEQWSSFGLVFWTGKSIECLICPEVTLCGWQDVRFQELTNYACLTCGSFETRPATCVWTPGTREATSDFSWKRVSRMEGQGESR